LLKQSLIGKLISENKAWQNLVETNNFNTEKALLSIEVTKVGYLERLSPKSVLDALKTPSVSLATLKKYREDIVLNSLLHKLIYDVADFFNVGKGLTDMQIEQVCILIFEDYYYLTVADLKCCFNKAKKGEYGKLYDRLDGAIIMEWIRTYLEERMEISAEISKKKHLEKMEYSIGTPMPGYVKELITKCEPQKEKTQSLVINDIDPFLMDFFKNEYKNSKAKQDSVEFEKFLSYEIMKLNLSQ